MSDQLFVQRQSIFNAKITTAESLLEALRVDKPYLQAETAEVTIVKYEEVEGIDYFTISASYFVSNSPTSNPYKKTELITITVDKGEISNFGSRVIEG